MYGVIGNPIEHSLSPFIHQQFAQQFNLKIDYKKILATKENFEKTVFDFFSKGGKGLNVTTPFKDAAYALSLHTSEKSNMAHAANTLTYKDGALFADITDGIGFINDLQRHQQFSMHDKNILLLGAGGAARALIFSILESKSSQLIVANRTLTNALNVAEQFAQYGSIVGCDFASIPKLNYDLVINATSTGLSDQTLELPSEIINPQTYCYDLTYKQTSFLTWAQQHNALKCLTGIGMLVEQAAESFFIWHGLRPQTADIIKKLN